MQAPAGYEGRFCSLIFPDADIPLKQRCTFVLKKGKNKGTVCGKAGARGNTIPCCNSHIPEYFEAVQVYRATCSFIDDSTGELFWTVDAFPRPEMPELDALFAVRHEAPPPPSVAQATEGDALIRTVNLGAIPAAIERSKDCVVCDLTEHPLILPCDHTVCVECMKRLPAQTCPMCRAPFEMTQLKRLL